MKLIIALLFTGLSFASEIRGIETCDLSFEKRPEQTATTSDCYWDFAETLKNSTQSASLELRRYSLEQSALSASWNAMRSPDLDTRAAAIAQGERASDELIKFYEKAGSGYYWSAIFLSQKAKDKDEGALIPNATLKALPKIKANLRKTIELDETIHGYGAHRVLGIIYTSVPALVGGDKKLGEKYFRTALQKAPRFSINPLYYGKFLLSDDRKNEAEVILHDLVTLSAEVFDSTRIPETELDQIEAIEALKK